MKILIVGGGGREHAIAWKFSQSPQVTTLYCAPGNAGIAQLATCVPIKATDLDAMVRFAVTEAIDLVFVAPDDPLALGMVDALLQAGIRAFGPSRAAARIEASKSFAKDLMRRYQIPTADYAVFESVEPALAYLNSCDLPIVIKADGLALGKGVIIAQTQLEAEQAVRDMLEGNAFGQAGSRVVIESFLTGPELTVLAFADGKTVVPMVSSRDHKRAFDHDQGPNTGGMGTIAPGASLSKEVQDQMMATIFQPTIHAMAAEGCPFKGVIYFGLMLTPSGPKVIEYNARFGDPEAQVVLPLLKTDLVDICLAVLEERLDQIEICWQDRSACCVVLASGGYPGAYTTGFPISGLDTVTASLVFHAGTRQEGAEIVTAGGRVLGVTAVSDSLEDAIRQAYRDVARIHFDQVHYRKDIGRT
ncbi:MAG: phosphoribosylamine--glycine ligase [Clostridia bacterium]|nr:phosphoribosylamine--glycine ligase [Clostridia bacterium]NCC74861.1 phosphoribosylamine--glycine ligase [Clostridia bacterium]